MGIKKNLKKNKKFVKCPLIKINNIESTTYIDFS